MSKFDSRLNGNHILASPPGLKTFRKSMQMPSQAPSMLRSFFGTFEKCSRRPLGGLLRGSFGKNAKFWPPSWPHVGAKTRTKRDKKGTKKATYVKTPLGLHFGPILGSFWGRFRGPFWPVSWCVFCFLFPVRWLCSCFFEVFFSPLFYNSDL